MRPCVAAAFMGVLFGCPGIGWTQGSGTQDTEKPLQLLELTGYFRLRSDVFYRLSLGLPAVTGSVAPFQRPLQAYGTETGMVCAGSSRSKSCRAETLRSTNMRLRLAPTFNLHRQVRVHMTVDLFDNLVLGSTPEGDRMDAATRATAAPFAWMSESQAVPLAGHNSRHDAIRVKHAWGEVDLPFGRLSFGRMPDHWGLGLVANSGTCRGYQRWTVTHRGDPERCTDSDTGDIVDRIQLTTAIPYVGLRVGLTWDFQATGLSALNLRKEDLALDLAQPFALRPADDLHQWTVFLGRIDSPATVRARLAAGEVVFNYGTRWVFQHQDRDYDVREPMTGLLSDLANRTVRRQVFAIMPDLWLRLHWDDLELELEGVYRYGRIRHTEALATLPSGARDLTLA
ncbi:MAG: hypothetical protein ACK2U9_10315, partial [Anaerolineae bacterium]